MMVQKRVVQLQKIKVISNLEKKGADHPKREYFAQLS
jgi:hypothetical protein